ncbi:hypothetical protein GH714_005923 [Hevea brasiliensis]|uniref:CBS domain-containing protein n=1 Tax=Hevea brasiliensis TaxID=3981 RepID=A0A6A6KY33_HEVBR|nr:hypothetical protein GH714_005923 [Hevea brasiliensis]
MVRTGVKRLHRILLDWKMWAIWARRRCPSFKILLVIIISFLTSCCSYGHPWLAPCIPCPPHLSDLCPTEGHYGYYNTFQSPPNHYNDLASLFFNTNDEAFRNLLTSSTKKKFKLITLLVFFVATCVLGILTYSIAIPSGLFIPVILAGASYGRLVGNLLGPLSCLDFLLISKIADRFNKGVHDQIVKLKGLPYMEMHAEPYVRHLVASDVVSGLLISFSGAENLGNMLHALKITGHNGFSVIDVPPYTDAPELCGLVLRQAQQGGEARGFDPVCSPYTGVELRHHQTMSLAKAAVPFREVGLRRFCVDPKAPGRLPIVGILTRHDFVPEHILGLYPHINHHK